MTTAQAVAPRQDPGGGHPDAASPRGSLLRAELHRITARRFVRVLVLLGVLGLVGGSLIASTQFAKPSPALLAQAQAGIEEQLASDRQYYDECLAAPETPVDDVENYCGPAPDAANYELAWFIDKSPFTLSDDLPAGVVAVGVATAALAFLVGATYVGAEWSSRSMIALLFWETRRLKVMAVKTVVTILAAVVLAVLAQGIWLAAAQALARTRGTTDVEPGFWGDLLAMQGRVLVLVVITALLGFGLANLIRNTGAALGIAFVYFAVLENAVRIVRPAWDQYLITTNAVALVNPGGLSLWVDDGDVDSLGNVESREIIVTNLHGGVTFALVCLVILVVGTVLFQRRDLH